MKPYIKMRTYSTISFHLYEILKQKKYMMKNLEYCFPLGQWGNANTSR